MLVEKLALGTVQFGLNYGISNATGQTDREEIMNILAAASQMGVNMLDTASVYGESEKLIGEIDSHSFKIVSKFPAVANSLDLITCLKDSLSKLKVNSLYGYLAHDADTLLRNPTIWLDLQELKNEEIVSKIGYSLYQPQQLADLLNAGCKPDIVQIPYSFADRRFEKQFNELKDIGCEIHVRSVFLQGLFFLIPADLGRFFDPAKPMLQALRNHFNSNNQIASFLLNFAIAQPQIDKIVFGVNTATQFMQNVKDIDIEYLPFDFEDVEIPEDILLPYKWPK